MGSWWLIALTCAATDLRLDASVRNENRAGLLATGPSTASARAADFELNPRLLLRLESPRTLTTLSYGPRFFYRVPDPLAVGPLVLHQADLELTATLSPVWSLATRAYLYGGEVDYSRALLIFDARTQTPATLPDAGTIRYLNTGGVVTLARALTEQARLNSSLQISTNRPLIGMGAEAYPTQNRAELSEQYLRPLGARDELQATVGLSETWYRPGPAYTSLSPVAGWRRQLTRRQELTLHLGALLVATGGYAAGAGVAPVERGVRFLPLVDGAYAHQVSPGGRVALRGEVTTGVTGFFEPIRAVVEPRGFVTLRGDLTLFGATQLRGVAALYTPLRRPSGASLVDPYPTVAYGDLAWRQVWQTQLATEVGARANTRAGPFGERPLRTNQPELVGYVAVVAAAELLE